MSQDRPLKDYTVADLEKIATTFTNHPQVLELVRAELGRRDSQEARGLLERLRSVEGATAPPSEPPAPKAPSASEDDFISRFLEARGLVEPNGQPLYRYHTRSAEVEALRGILSASLGSYRLGSRTAMAFCLWASEWWRRNYMGGPWKWETLLSSVGRPEFAPGGGRYNDLQRLVTRGLRGWRRSVLTVGESRGFLVTLACEGGLPLMLILRDQTHLRAYLKGVLEEFRLFGATSARPRDLAERVRDRLPKGLRQEVVYELSADLIQKIWRFQREIGETRTPVQDLDRVHAGWRDELPVRVTDAVARTLLNGLLLDAVEVARGGRMKVRWNIRLMPLDEEGWNLRGSFHLPTVLDSEDFNLLFGQSGDSPVPSRFDLSVQAEGEPSRILALVTERVDKAGRGYLGLELMPPAREFHAKGLTRPRKLVARTQNQEFLTDLFPGATGLTELPWVFVPEDPEASTRQTYRLVGQGSVRVRDPWALVAVAAEESVREGEGSEKSLVGSLDEGSRLIYRIAGALEICAADGSRAVVETRATRDTAKIEFRLRGREQRLGRSGTTVFLGRPSLLERPEAGFPSTVPAQELWWKPDGPEGQWGPYGFDTVGSGLLRYIENGVVRHSVRARILPDQARIEIRPSPEPRQGQIHLIGFDGAAASVTQPDDLSVETYNEEAVHRLLLTAGGAPPNDVTVALDWGTRGRLEVSLPFPSTHAGFFLPGGRELPSESNVALGSLAGVRAEAVVPWEADFDLQCQYVGLDSSTMGRHHGMFTRQIPEVGRGHYSLDLALLQPMIEDCLALSDDPDGAVRLFLYSTRASQSLPYRRVFVKRFDLQLECREHDPPVVGLDDQARLQALPEEIEALELEALSLLEPDRDLIPLERVGSDAWRIPGEQLDHGPYLILGRQGDWLRGRPMRWYVIHQERGLGPEVQQPITLKEAYQSGLHREGDESPFLSVAKNLAAKPGHQDWSAVFKYFEQTSLPVQIFPLLRALARHPTACAMTAVRAGAIDFELLWKRMESFSFAWWQIPLSSWEEAFRTYVEYQRQVFGSLDDQTTARELLEASVDSRLDRITENLRGLHPALGFLRASLLSTPVPAEVGRICDPTVQELLRNQYSAHRLSCPALHLSPLDMVDLSEVFPRVCHSMVSYPWSKSVFVKRSGQFETEERANFADAPALSAVMVLTGLSPASGMGRLMRKARSQDPTWFDEALQLAQLIAFGCMTNSIARDYTDA